MSKKYEVQTTFMSGRWENVWHQNEKPLYFDSKEEAQTAIDEFVETTEIECALEYLSTAVTHDEFRIVEVEL